MWPHRLHRWKGRGRGCGHSHPQQLGKNSVMAPPDCRTGGDYGLVMWPRSGAPGHWSSVAVSATAITCHIFAAQIWHVRCSMLQTPMETFKIESTCTTLTLWHCKTLNDKPHWLCGLQTWLGICIHCAGKIAQVLRATFWGQTAWVWILLPLLSVWPWAGYLNPLWFIC